MIKSSAMHQHHNFEILFSYIVNVLDTKMTEQSFLFWGVGVTTAKISCAVLK